VFELILKNRKMAEELEPHIVENYKIVQRLGKGAYGVVWRAVDNKTNE
jgi:mitogen-activated protein kinase 15